MRRLVVAAIAVAAFTVSGCSEDEQASERASDSGGAPVNPLEESALQGTDAQGAEEAVRTYIEAVRAGDGQVGCFVLDEAVRQRLVAAHDGADCAEAFAAELANPDTTAQVDAVELAEDGQSATVRVDHTHDARDAAESVRVVNTGGVWLLDDTYSL